MKQKGVDIRTVHEVQKVSRPWATSSFYISYPYVHPTCTHTYCSR